MKKLLLAIAALSVLAISFVAPSVALASPCPGNPLIDPDNYMSDNKVYCWCSYPSSTTTLPNGMHMDPQCINETTNLWVRTYILRTCSNLQDFAGQCQNDCPAAGLIFKQISPSPDTFCNFNTSNNSCSDPLNPSSPACLWCFGSFTSTSACAGFTTKVKATSYDTNCAALVQRAGLENPQTVHTYNDLCDDQVSGNQCVHKSSQNKPGCDQAISQKASGNAANANTQQNTLGQGVPVGLPTPVTSTLPKIIGRVISQVLGIVGGIALLFFVYGGVSWMLAAGNEKRIETAKNTLVYAALGLVAIFAAYTIVSFIISKLTS